jgi:hypothetical protein
LTISVQRSVLDEAYTKLGQPDALYRLEQDPAALRPTHLAQASQLSVSVESVERPQLFWSFAGARLQGDVVELRLRRPVLFP